MIRQRIRISGLVAVAIAAAATAPSAIAMPIVDAGGSALPASHPASIVVRANPDQQAPSRHASPPSRHASRVQPSVPAPPMVRVPLDQSASSSHATPSAATPAGGSIKHPGSSFDWAAVGIGIGALGVVGLAAVAFRSVTRRSRHPRRQRVAASS